LGRDLTVQRIALRLFQHPIVSQFRQEPVKVLCRRGGVSRVKIAPEGFDQLLPLGVPALFVLGIRLGLQSGVPLLPEAIVFRLAFFAESFGKFLAGDGLAVLNRHHVRADVTYLVVGRDPRDVAVSFEHHAANLDWGRFLALRAAAVGNGDLAGLPEDPVPSEDPAERFRAFVDGAPGGGGPATLATVLHHLDTGWRRRREPNVALVHYADLTADLPGELLRLAGVLGIPCSADRARELAAEASLTRMRERAAEAAPSGSQGIWTDARAFFRRGGSGEWRGRVSAADLAAYGARVAALVGPDLAAWAHGGRLASGVDPDR